AAASPLNASSDWYAVGVILFQVLTGRLPFEGTLAEVLARKQQVDGPSPSEIVSGIPSDLDHLVAALTRRDPIRRPGVDEILATLGNGETAAGGSPMLDLFVGRTTHLGELKAAFDASRSGRTVVCHVSGRSGAGKSTLVSRFLEGVAGSDGAIVLRGRCYEQESVPYKALDDLVDALAHHLLRLPPPEIERVVPPHMAALARVFPVLERVQTLADRGLREARSDDLRDVRRHAFAALRSLLAELARQRPVVL